MSFRLMLLIAVGIGLAYVSHVVGLRGDAARFAEHGVSTERAGYHLTALIILLGALGCFIAAGVMLLRRWRR
jgi:hypothetical protein